MSKVRKTEFENEDGWTDWIHPKGNEEGIYQLGCCDCDLIHDFEFIVARRGKKLDDIWSEWKRHKNENLIVVFRARRNRRCTAQTRRWKKK